MTEDKNISHILKKQKKKKPKKKPKKGNEYVVELGEIDRIFSDMQQLQEPQAPAAMQVQAGSVPSRTARAASGKRDGSWCLLLYLKACNYAISS